LDVRGAIRPRADEHHVPQVPPRPAHGELQLRIEAPGSRRAVRRGRLVPASACDDVLAHLVVIVPDAPVAIDAAPQAHRRVLPPRAIQSSRMARSATVAPKPAHRYSGTPSGTLV